VDLDLIVVDSGSTDRTLDIAGQYHARILLFPKNEPFDYSRSLNLGWQAAETEGVFFCSSHVWLSHRNAVEALRDSILRTESHAGYIARSGLQTEVTAERFDSEPAETHYDVLALEDFRRLRGIGFFSNHASLIPRSLLEKRPFQVGLPCAEDLDWARHWAEQEIARFVKLTHPLAVYANPYETEKKRSRERVFTYQHFFRHTPWLRTSIGCIGKTRYYVMKGEWQNAWYTFREAWMYPISRIRPFRFTSAYH